MAWVARSDVEPKTSTTRSTTTCERRHVNCSVGSLPPVRAHPDTRRRARFSELSEPDRTVADRFVQARLLVADRDLATREPVIEVAHEALLVNWPRLREWLEADRRWLAQLQHLATTTRTWDHGSRPDGELYRGSRLEAVLEALPDHSQQLSDDEHAFIDASRIGARCRARARAPQRTAGSADDSLRPPPCSCSPSSPAGIALTQRQQARDSARDRESDARCAGPLAESERANAQTAQGVAESSQREAQLEALIGRSLSLRATQRDTAALLAVEAYRMAHDTTSEVGAVLHVYGRPRRARRRSVAGVLRDRPEEGGRSPDGRAFVTDINRTLRPYNLETGEVGDPWLPLSVDDRYIEKLIPSADGRLLVEIGWFSANIVTDRGVRHAERRADCRPDQGPIRCRQRNIQSGRITAVRLR